MWAERASASIVGLEGLCSELGLDRERAKGWTIAQAVACSCGDDSVEPHDQTVRWLPEEA